MKLSTSEALSAAPPLRSTPAPWTKLSIPQPEDSDRITNSQPLPDSDPPVQFWDFPAKPPLPVAKK